MPYCSQTPSALRVLPVSIGPKRPFVKAAAKDFIPPQVTDLHAYQTSVATTQARQICSLREKANLVRSIDGVQARADGV